MRTKKMADQTTSPQNEHQRYFSTTKYSSNLNLIRIYIYP